MKKYICPLSDVAIAHIEALTQSYKQAVDAACDYNGIALANKKQIENALKLADHLGQTIECYLRSWECGSPCLNYSCGWEYCQRNLQILNAMPNLPDLPEQDYSTDINLNATVNEQETAETTAQPPEQTAE